MRPPALSRAAWLVLALVLGVVGGLVGSWLGPAFLYRVPSADSAHLGAGIGPQGSATPATRAAQFVGPAVVGVISRRDATLPADTAASATSIGTGVVYDRKGDIVTNDHVIAGSSAVRVELPSGRRLPAEVVGTDPQTDLAVLRVKTKAPLPVARFGNSDDVRIGETVVAIGNPLGLDFPRSVTSGVVSGIRSVLYGYTGPRPVAFDPARQRVTELIQTDAAINRGNSGGPLVDASGRVVGINTLKGPAQGDVEGMGFAIPANLVRRVADDLIAHGAVQRATLGVSFPYLGDDPLTGNARVSLRVGSVAPNGPAAAAGVRPGDLVTGLDGHAVADYLHLLGSLEMHHPGDTVTLTVWRDGRRHVCRVRLGRLQTDP